MTIFHRAEKNLTAAGRSREKREIGGRFCPRPGAFVAVEAGRVANVGDVGRAIGGDGDRGEIIVGARFGERLGGGGALEADGAVERFEDFAVGEVGESETEFALSGGDADDGVLGDVDQAEDDAVVGDGAGSGRRGFALLPRAAGGLFLFLGVRAADGERAGVGFPAGGAVEASLS